MINDWKRLAWEAPNLSHSLTTKYTTIQLHMHATMMMMVIIISIMVLALLALLAYLVENQDLAKSRVCR